TWINERVKEGDAPIALTDAERQKQEAVPEADENAAMADTTAEAPVTVPAAPVAEAPKAAPKPESAPEPEPAPAKPAPAKAAPVAATGNVKAQIGAFRSEAEARTHWKNLQK